ELVDGGAAGGKVRHHLRRDGGRKGRDALRGDAVIAGEYQHVDALEPGRAALPAREPGDQLLEPAEAAGRLGQLRLAGGDGGGSGLVARRQVEAGGAQGGEGGKGDGHVASDSPPPASAASGGEGSRVG